MKKTITVDCDSVNVVTKDHRHVSVTIEDVDLADLVREVGSDELLDEIGKKEAVSHFDIVEAEE